jgi:putative spermidine/putrescine transport system permease protein
MIAQVIISIIQEVLNWRFASALAVMLLAATALVFLLYDRILGLSNLSGGAGSESGAIRPPGMLARLGAMMGGRLIGMLGWLSDRGGQLWEALVSVRPDRRQRSVARGVLLVSAALIIAFLCVPSFFVIPVSFTSGNFVEFPPQGFSLRWYELYFGASDWIAATVRSFVVALLTGAVATVLGTAAAFVLVRQAITGRGVILGLILAPLVLPRIIIAVGLFYLYARIGLVGTVLGLVIGHTILAIPYVVITVMAVLKTYDERLDQAAWSLGASKWRTLIHITLIPVRLHHVVRRADDFAVRHRGQHLHPAPADVERPAAASEPDAGRRLDDRPAVRDRVHHCGGSAAPASGPPMSKQGRD